VTRRFAKINSSTRAALTSVLDVLGRQLQSSSSWMSVFLFSNSLHHFLTHCVLMASSPYTSVNWRCGEADCIHKTESHYEILRRIMLLMSLLFHISLPHEYYLALASSVACHHDYKCYFLPKNKMLDQQYLLNIPYSRHENYGVITHYVSCRLPTLWGSLRMKEATYDG